MESNSLLNSGEKAPAPRQTRGGAMFRWVLVVLVLLGGVSAFYWFHSKPPDAAAANVASSGDSVGKDSSGPAPSVTAMAARQIDMPIYLRGLGSVVAYNTVTVRPLVDGELIRINFKEGQYVHQADVLAEIDKRPFEVQLQQGQSQLAQAQGNLVRDEGILKGQVTEFDRNTQLLARGIIPRQQQDLQGASVSQTQGSILADKASIQTAQAAIDSAKLQIVYSQVTAPISGLIGLRFVDPGNVVHAADTTGLAVITQVEPIAVLFNIPEDNLASVLKKLHSGQSMPVEAFDRDDRDRLASGKLLTIDNQIDQTTGTSRLKAVFDNKDNALFPNQFVNVHLLLDTEKNATVIPTSAIQQGPKGTYVYVVDSERKVRIRYVTVRNTEGSEASIGSELHPGEVVVVDGTDKVQDGAKVDVQMTTGEGSGS